MLIAALATMFTLSPWQLVLDDADDAPGVGRAAAEASGGSSHALAQDQAGSIDNAPVACSTCADPEDQYSAQCDGNCQFCASFMLELAGIRPPMSSLGLLSIAGEIPSGHRNSEITEPPKSMA